MPSARGSRRTGRTDGLAASRHGFRGYAPPPAAVTVPYAARVLSLDPRTVRAMVRAGELHGNRFGRAIRVSTASIAAWLRGPSTASPPQA